VRDGCQRAAARRKRRTRAACGSGQRPKPLSHPRTNMRSDPREGNSPVHTRVRDWCLTKPLSRPRKRPAGAKAARFGPHGLEVEALRDRDQKRRRGARQQRSLRVMKRAYASGPAGVALVCTAPSVESPSAFQLRLTTRFRLRSLGQVCRQRRSCVSRAYTGVTRAGAMLVAMSGLPDRRVRGRPDCCDRPCAWTVIRGQESGS
jgi:hypothetical protein